MKRRKRRRYKAQGTALAHVKKPNQVWCADYKRMHLTLNNEATKTASFIFLQYDLGFFDRDEARIEPAANPCVAVPEKV